MEKREKVLLLPEQMRAIARYETDFAELAGLPEDYDEITDYVEVREHYQYTLEDLREALRNLIEKNPTVGEFSNFWLFPLWELEAFGINDARDRKRWSPSSGRSETGSKGFPERPCCVFCPRSRRTDNYE